MPEDFDRTHLPWLVAKEDGSVWIAERGQPADGWHTHIHAVVVEKDGSHGFVTAARASRMPDPPTTEAELGIREKRRQRAEKRREEERQSRIKAARISARVVLLTDVDPSLRGAPETLRGAAERLADLGGYVRVTRGRVEVRVPPGELHENRLGRKLATIIYAAEQAILDAVKKDGEVDPARLPDKAVLPTGGLA